MCGISGIVNKQGAAAYNSGDLRKMTEAIRHRGPDDVGYLLFTKNGQLLTAGDDDTPAEVYSNTAVSYRPQSPIANLAGEEFSMALGHRRLSILDLSAYGHLPMSTADGRYWITYNGEIYNFHEVRKELEEKGYHFISQGDTEVIIAAYAVWGKDCLEKFRGMWAFAIFDSVEQEIFLSRDRFGIKPLYYWVSPTGAFCFASEIKQFTFLPGWRAVLNGQRAYDHLMYALTDHTKETLFKGVYVIPAGHYFKAKLGDITAASDGSISTQQWYSPGYKGFNGTFEEAAAGFRTNFQRSVKEHLIADVPVGSALSGGLDSSAVVCEIDALLHSSGNNHKQSVFSYCADDDRYNEKKWMDEVINNTNVDPHFVYVKGTDVFKTAEDMVWFLDEPYQSQALLASYFVFKSAKDNNIKVLLNGQGADEYLSAYGGFRQFRWVQLLKQFRFKQLNKEIKTAGGSSIPATYIQLCYFIVPSFVRRFFVGRKPAYRQLRAVISLEKLKATETHPYDDIPFQPTSIFNIAHKQVLHDPLQKYLRYEDRMSMCNSLESRVPFLDHKLVEYTTNLPADYLDSAEETKRILKNGLKNILPEKIRLRKDKIGYITSEELWVKSQFTNEFREMMKRSIESSAGVIKPEALQYYDGMVNGTIPFDYSYWWLIAFGIWMKRFNVELE